MKDFTFIHTNWTKPALNGRWGVNSIEQIINNIWYYSLSAAYVKRLGKQIELHTDNFGKLCLDHIPYNKIHLTLNSIPKYIKPYMWAYGKFHALKRCPLNTIHIDADVFIKSPKCLNKVNDLLSSKCDVIVQCHEFVVNPNRWSYAIYKPSTEALRKLRYPEWAERNGKNAYNTGFVLFNNQTLKNEYLKEYFRCSKDCCVDLDLEKSLRNDEHVCPDLVIEQQFLYDVINKKHFKVGLLINWLNSNRTADQIDYQHIIGKGKYNANNMYMCKKTLMTINYELYMKTLNKTNYIREYLNKNKNLYENKI